MKLKEREMIGYECLLAHKKIWSTGCPYLALADQLGYLTAYAVRKDPHLGLSNFGRLSVKKMLKNAGFSIRYAKFIYRSLECGEELDQIGKDMIDGYCVGMKGQIRMNSLKEIMEIKGA
jgi:hypothetical protein